MVGRFPPGPPLILGSLPGCFTPVREVLLTPPKSSGATIAGTSSDTRSSPPRLSVSPTSEVGRTGSFKTLSPTPTS